MNKRLFGYENSFVRPLIISYTLCVRHEWFHNKAASGRREQWSGDGALL